MALELNGTTGVSLVQDGVITDANLPAGSVLQVVSTSYSTEFTTSSGSAADTGLSVTITPTSATSKILILLSQQMYIYNGGGDSGVIINILRNGTNLIGVNGHSGYIAGYNSSNPEIVWNLPITFLDSPATTSALTYKTQAAATVGATVITCWNSNASTITVMEIAA